MKRIFARFVKSPVIVGLLIGILVGMGVIGLRSTGNLEFLELAAYDAYLRLQPQASSSDPRIVLIPVSESDIHEYGYPLPDGILARLLKNLIAFQPRAVGLDIFRDIPVPPGSEELISVFSGEYNRIVTILKVGNEKESGVSRPYMVKDPNLVGFNDFVVDPGGIVRRGLLFLDDGETVYYSFPLLLAMLYLEGEGIFPQAGEPDPQYLRLGKTTFVPFEADDGGYVHADARGYQFLLDFRGERTPFTTLSVTEVLGGKIPPNLLQDKIVIIGATAESLKDFFFTPFSRSLSSDQRMTGVELHARTVSQLLRSALTGSRPVATLTEKSEWLWIMLWSLSGYALGLRIRSLWRFVASITGGTVALTLITLILFREGWWVPVVPPVLGLLFSAGLITAYLSYQENVQRTLLMHLFSRHVSKDVAEVVWQQRDQFMNEGRPRPQKLIATVLFTDLKGFSTISEKLSPQSLMDWLNEYMEAMAHVVMEHGGVVNKYIGDAVMAIFGVPVARVDEAEISRDAVNAVNCALAMKRELERLNSLWHNRGLPNVGMRVGIFTGPLVAGSLGSSQRMEYTVIGDTVNTASRLESFNKDFDPENTCRILIGEATLQRLNHRFETREVGSVSLKGKNEKVTLYQVMGPAN